MLKHPALTETRLERAIARIEPLVHGPTVPLTVEIHRVTGEPVPCGVAAAAAYEPFEVGGAWGAAWETAWFRVREDEPPAPRRPEPEPGREPLPELSLSPAAPAPAPPRRARRKGR